MSPDISRYWLRSLNLSWCFLCQTYWAIIYPELLWSFWLHPRQVCFWKNKNSDTIQGHRLKQILSLQAQGSGWEQLNPNEKMYLLPLNYTWKTHLQQKISFRNLVLHQLRCFTLVIFHDFITAVQGDCGRADGNETEWRQKSRVWDHLLWNVFITATGIPHFQRDPVCEDDEGTWMMMAVATLPTHSQRSCSLPPLSPRGWCCPAALILYMSLLFPSMSSHFYFLPSTLFWCLNVEGGGSEV